jgi:long-chain acyl-CoA synthetase
VNTALLLLASARTAPDSPAVSHGDRLVHSYGELARRAASLCTGLRKLTSQRQGARVALVMPNRPEAIEAMWACWMAGLIVVPINARLHPKEMSYILAHSGASVCLTVPDFADALARRGLQHKGCEIIDVDSTHYRRLCSADFGEVFELDSAAPAWIFYTSGTTGNPKGAVLSHGSLQAMAWRYYADIDHLGLGDTLLHTSALSHGGGLFTVPHIAKCTHSVIPMIAPAIDPRATFDLIDKHRQISFVVSPTILQQLAEHPAAVSSKLQNIKTILYGSAPIAVSALKTALDVFGPCLWQGYGQGETPGTLTHLDKVAHADKLHPRYEERLRSVGVARTGVELKIVRPDGTTAETDEIGEVVCRSDVTMCGYWQSTTDTAATIQNGWLHTGDLGALDKDGFLTLKDRLNDLIITEGLNVYPREIEDVLRISPAIRDVAVVGHPDPVIGERIVAFVTAKSEIDHPCDAVLQALCRSHLAKYKIPAEFVWLTSLPRNNTGKIVKTALRKRLE